LKVSGYPLAKLGYLGFRIQAVEIKELKKNLV